jgi:succinyl-diaminopimelate desuccinylase
VKTQTSSIISLIEKLVATPSQGGVEACDAMIGVVSTWLKSRVPFRVLTDSAGLPVAVVITVRGSKPGPTYCLDACLDTASVGDIAKWSFPPFAAAVKDGWLYGRGACDSKAAVAIFCHLAAGLQRRRSKLNFAGTLHVLFDADEHTGRFGGVKEYLAQCGRPDGVIIGYPGNDFIASGARGFYRTEITVHGKAAHSGSSSSSGANAVVKAAALAAKLGAVDAATIAPVNANAGFAMPGKVTVTEIGGGSGYTAVPDSCRIRVDCRLTPDFQAPQARELVVGLVAEVDGSFGLKKEFAGVSASTILEEESWPAYSLKDSKLLAALSDCAREVYGKEIPARVVGPSNIGNYLSGQGIDTICGFGVTYKGLHASDECIELASIEAVIQTYRLTVERLLGLSASVSPSCQ